MSFDIDDCETLQDFKNLITIKIESKGKGHLSLENLKKILDLYRTILLLKKHDITTNNYNDKVKIYNKDRTSILEKYGRELGACPFENPTKLYIEIEKILKESKYNTEQIKLFYTLTQIRDKALRSDTIYNNMSYIQKYFVNVNKLSEEDQQALNQQAQQSISAEEYEAQCKIEQEMEDAEEKYLEKKAKFSITNYKYLK